MVQSYLDLKVWSCYILRNELLGIVFVNFFNVLKNNGGKMENMQLILNLQMENKGSVVLGGELIIFLDGLIVDLGSVFNGSVVIDGLQLFLRDFSGIVVVLENWYQFFSINCFGGRFWMYRYLGIVVRIILVIGE